MRILNVSKGEVRLDTKSVGSTRFPTLMLSIVP